MMEHHDQDEVHAEATVESLQQADGELTDEDLDAVAGGDITVTKHPDSSTPNLFNF